MGLKPGKQGFNFAAFIHIHGDAAYPDSFLRETKDYSICKQENSLYLLREKNALDVIIQLY